MDADVQGQRCRQERWRRLEHLDSVATTHLITWYRAVTMQAERVLDADRDHVDRQIDGYQFVHVLRQALRAVCMLRDQLTGPVQAVAQTAVSRFEAVVPDAKNARDVLDPFDDYARGTGTFLTL